MNLVCASPEKQSRGTLFYGLERSCCKPRAHWRKLKVQSIVTFHWLSYDLLPLAELFLGKEESFLPLAEVVSLPIEDAN